MKYSILNYEDNVYYEYAFMIKYKLVIPDIRSKYKIRKLIFLSLKIANTAAKHHKKYIPCLKSPLTPAQFNWQTLNRHLDDI